MWQLIINGPGYFDTAYDLPEGVTQVGRADENDIVLSGDLVSRKHCRLHVRSSGVVFEDLGSRNGTRLNREPVTGSVDLKAGDVVVRVDPRYFRPAEVETLLGDPTKAKQQLGWVPEITAQEMCAEMVAADLDTARQHALLKSHGHHIAVSKE